MKKSIRYFFGEKDLSGYARQQINKDGELSYKGVIHIFGSKVPIFISLEPHEKYVKGEKLYKVFTYLTPMPAEMKGSALQTSILSANSHRIKAIKKVQQVVLKLGDVYEYQRVRADEKKRRECNACKARINSEWEEKLKEQELQFKAAKKELAQEWRDRLQRTVKRHVKRQREICEQKIQRLLACRQRNK